MTAYNKALAALAAPLAVLAEALADGKVDSGEVFTLVAALAAAFGVYLVPNINKAPGSEG